MVAEEVLLAISVWLLSASDSQIGTHSHNLSPESQIHIYYFPLDISI